ncbi:MAG: phenol hydroxylase subunit P4, partial [Hydrogenophaga sp.]|nr:phenol hydroxylase subunit P4 [Hydrogenophaga sp.]
MSVTAIGTYDFPMKDVRENFPAPLLYIGWEDHLMFCAPFCLP